MRNHERRAPLHQGVHAALHQRFGARVDGGCRFVQNQRGRVGNRGAGNGQQLPLPLREIRAVARQHRIVAVGQLADELVRVGDLMHNTTILFVFLIVLDIKKSLFEYMLVNMFKEAFSCAQNLFL